MSVLQLLDVDPQDQAEEDGANVDLDSQRKGKCAVIKTSTRQVRSNIGTISFLAYHLTLGIHCLFEIVMYLVVSDTFQKQFFFIIT